MIGRSLDFRRVAAPLAAIGVAASVAGCGKTLVFAERDGVNFAVRANGSSAPPIEANFGLNRTIATIVPPAGETANNKADGDAVSMFAGFQIDNTLDPQKGRLKADLQISTQFASGEAATLVATKPDVVIAIVNPQAGAKVAATIDAQTDFIVTTISCDADTLVDDLYKKLIVAADTPGLARVKTVTQFRKAIRNAPTDSEKLYNAAIKQGRAKCPN